MPRKLGESWSKFSHSYRSGPGDSVRYLGSPDSIILNYRLQITSSCGVHWIHRHWRELTVATISALLPVSHLII